MAFQLIDDGDYRLGVIRDIAAWQLPRGALQDGLNMIFDQPGIARQRGGTTALVSGAQTSFATMLGFAYSQDATPIEELYGLDGKAGGLNLINKTTGAATSLGTPGVANSVVGRPCRHFGMCVFPSMPPAGTQQRKLIYVAGQTSSTTFTNAVAANVVANNQQITLTGADVTTNIKVGAIVSASDGTATGYYGRVVSIDTTKLFTVWPTPKVTFTAAIGGLTTFPTTAQVGGGCVASFQNRLLTGNTTDMLSVGQTLVTDRRIYYSPLPTETSTSSNTGATLNGAHFIVPVYWPDKNFIELPAGGPIVALEPVSDNELLILTADGAWIFRGDLATQTTTFAPGVTFDLFPLNTNAGCLSDLSVQRTPEGIVWASREGVMIYRGGNKVDNLTEDRIHTEWMRLTNVASFALHGSGYVAGHYIVTGAPGYNAASTFAWAVRLDGIAWGNLENLDWFYAQARPTIPQQVFAVRWWDQSGAAPSRTNGQTLRVDSIFAADVWGQAKLDADGSVVNFFATTRLLTDDLQTMRLPRLVSVRYQADFGVTGASAAPGVALGSHLDAQEGGVIPIVGGVGTVSNTAQLTVSAATNATPIVVTTSVAHGYQSEDEVDTLISGNLAASGRWRITVLSTTTFSLNGSSGSGAFTSGTVKKVTEQTFTSTGITVQMGQGHFVFVNHQNANALNRFELHGVRMSVMEFGRGLGRAS